jgi:hypothetical protein
MSIVQDMVLCSRDNLSHSDPLTNGGPKSNETITITALHIYWELIEIQ